MSKGYEINNGSQMDAVGILMDLRIFAYSFLKRIYFVEPSQEFFRIAKLEKVIDSFPFADENQQIAKGKALVSDYLKQRDILQEEEFQKLHWDFTKMFIGPDELIAPPWESSYMNEDKLLFQKETLEVRYCYLKYGYIPKNFPREADDHIGLELDFMYQLNELAKKQFNQGNIAQMQEILQEQLLFLQNHLTQWVPQLTENIIKGADTDFYRGTAYMLAGLIALDQAAIQEILAVIKDCE